MKRCCTALILLICGLCAWADEQLAVRHLVAPSYPRLARQAHVEGSIQVEILIGTDGKVLSAKSLGGHGILKQASEENIKLWVFTDQKSVTKTIVTYVYSLAGTPTYHDPPPRIVFDFPNHVEITSRPATIETTGAANL